MWRCRYCSVVVNYQVYVEMQVLSQVVNYQVYVEMQVL